MTDDPSRREVPGYMSEDLHPVIVFSPDRFALTATGQVQYAVVKTSHRVLGYLWFSDAENAVGFIPKASEGLDGRQAKVAWGAKLRRQHDKGLTPSQAVLAVDGDDRIGYVAVGSAWSAASLNELRAIAAMTHTASSRATPHNRQTQHSD
jgi:hypothetical protein